MISNQFNIYFPLFQIYNHETNKNQSQTSLKSFWPNFIVNYDIYIGSWDKYVKVLM